MPKQTKREELVRDRYFEFRDLNGSTIEEELAELVREAKGKQREEVNWKWKKHKKRGEA
jgi:hypothetical protein